MAQVYALRLDEEISNSLYQILIPEISAGKKYKIEKFFRKEDAFRCLFAELLIRYALIKNFGLVNKDISFQYSPYGKPSLKGSNTIHFNLSHSGEWIVCATDDQPVGIDIERIAPTDLQVAEHYFSIREKEQLFSLPLSEQLHFFYELWTLKESFVKQRGEGLSMQLNSFTISIGTDKKITLKEAALKALPLFFRQYDLDKDYKMAVCGSEDAFENVVRVRMSNIIDYFG